MIDKKKQRPDWDLIEIDYRAGIKTLRTIADENGLSHVAIAKRAKRDNWGRDLAAKIKAKADLLVNKNLVNKSVTKERMVTENQIIDAAAETQATIILAHRKDVSKARLIGTKLFYELEKQTDDPELFKKLGELMANPDTAYDRINDAYKKVIAMPGRVDAYKKLSEALKTCVGLERQVFGIADNANGEANKPSPYDLSLEPIDAYKQMVHGKK